MVEGGRTLRLVLTAIPQPALQALYVLHLEDALTAPMKASLSGMWNVHAWFIGLGCRL